MEIQTSATNDVAVIQKSIEIFKTAPSVLQSNRSRTDKAIAVGNKLLDEWNAALKIGDEQIRMDTLSLLEDRSNKYMLNCSNAVSELKQLRSAITQLMDNFKSMFTSAENEIDKSKPDSIPSKVQLHRNNYVGEVKKISDRKKDEAEAIMLKGKEEAELYASAESQLFKNFNEYVFERKTALHKSFNSITLETFEEKKEKLYEYTPEFKDSMLESILITLKGRFHSVDETDAIIAEVKRKGKRDLSNSYCAELDSVREELIDNLGSKHNELLEEQRLEELERIAKENAAKEKDKNLKAQLKQQAEDAENKRIALNKEKEEREEKDRNKLAAETASADEEAQLKIDVAKQGKEALAMFDNQVTEAENESDLKIKESFEIEILHPVAYTQIFAIWFEIEGSKLPVTKLGNTKLDQMKAWCERRANKDDIKIESKFLKYNEVVVAKNRKSAKD